ncbi:glucuronyl hydrolase [Pedobacter sp. BS3]|nr:glucuronyl hydrolase [Pedobacter sp. BS3]
MKKSFNLWGLLLLNLAAINVVAQQKNELKPLKAVLKTVNQSLSQSVKQYMFLAKELPQDKFPRSYENGWLLTSGIHAWTSGFYPGTLLYLYEYAKDSTLKREALTHLKPLEKLQFVTTTHDLGFMMYCSFGNAYRIFGDKPYKDILVQSAKSLATRFNPKVGCIKSWDKVQSLDGKTWWEFPVIIDNMMNLELLFFASKVTGDASFRNIAIKHAETTMKNHIRPDYSSYHVVNYDPETGKVKSRETHQGYADNSTWARGQAWGIYGFTMVYRETKDKRFLETACKMADFFLNNPNLPKDKIPYWDFNINQPGFRPQWNYDAAKFPVIPRDASAAAITASALIELSGYVAAPESKRYLEAAGAMLTSLSSPAYRAPVGDNGGFILKHSTGGVPSNAEIDVPLTYADYYYVEALLRYKNLGK